MVAVSGTAQHPEYHKQNFNTREYGCVQHFLEVGQLVFLRADRFAWQTIPSTTDCALAYFSISQATGSITIVHSSHQILGKLLVCFI